MDEDVERQLRRALSRNAQAAPGGAAMLAAVWRESARRRTRRRAALGATLAAVALVTGVLAAPLAVAHRHGPNRVPALTAAIPTTVSFAPGAEVPSAFPYTPHVPLLGQATPLFTIAAAQPTLRYQSTRVSADWATVVASAEPWRALPATSTTRPVKVRGRQGLTAADNSVSDSPEILLRWSESLWWLEIRAPVSTPLPELIAYANGMSNQPLAQPAPFTFEETPVGFTVDNLSTDMVSFCPPGVVPSADFAKKLTVLVDSAPSAPPSGRMVRVGPRTGWLAISGGITMLRFGDSAGLQLTIQVGEGIRVAEQDLLTFAAGIRTTSAATPGNG